MFVGYTAAANTRDSGRCLSTELCSLPSLTSQADAGTDKSRKGASLHALSHATRTSSTKVL